MQRLVFISGVWIVLCLPIFADASVMISEVSWMGSVDDANAEWIELYNDGESQNVSGWTLVASDGQPSITLEGSIGGHAYALLERTDDDTVAGVRNGALANLHDGDIILAHVSSDSVATALDDIITTIQRAGYSIVTVSQLDQFKN